MDSCARCHAFPTIGGASPFVNPQIAVATKAGARNTIPAFVLPNGPVREARFVRDPDGTPGGGVHDLFVIKGRTDAPGLQHLPAGFCHGIENQKRDLPYSQQKKMLGIGGLENRSGNDGTITRFGWKAQNRPC